MWVGALGAGVGGGVRGDVRSAHFKRHSTSIAFGDRVKTKRKVGVEGGRGAVLHASRNVLPQSLLPTE